VGDAEAYGFELESTFKPIEPVTLSANLGYTHFKYTKLRPELEQVGSVGVHNRPKWTNTFSAEYETEPVFSGATLQFLVVAKHRSNQLLTSTVVPFRPQYYVDAAQTGTVWLFDARATLGNIKMGRSGLLKTSIWGKNIVNSKKINYGADLVGAMTAKYENAATYEIDVTVEF
jgi:iron complex outermembrane receptor protein